MNNLSKKYLIPITIALSSLSVYYLWKSTDVSCISYPNASYTYIIGGGTAGCVLASRLSENPHNRVLLIEAGGHINNFYSSIPSLFVFLQKSKDDWSYDSTSQKWSSFGFKQKKQALARGKGLGGSGEINCVIYNGIHRDTLNNNFSNFIRGCGPETCHYLDKLIPPQHCTTTRKPHFPLYLKRSSPKLGEVAKQAVEELGDPSIRYHEALSTIFKGERWSTYRSHLIPAIGRPNLHILCNVEVVKIIFENRKAIGLQYLDGTIYSEKEIIISAGSINTPKLLLASGVGNKTELDKLGISTIANLPGVGLNLHDHFSMPIYVHIQAPLSVTMLKMLNLKEIFNYLVYREGLYASSPVMAIVKSRRSYNIMFAGSTPEEPFLSVSNYLPQTFRTLLPFSNSFSKEGMILLAGCRKPKSRGFVKLDVNKEVVVDPQYLQHEDDVRCIQEGGYQTQMYLHKLHISAVVLASKIVNSTAFQNIGASIHLPEIENCNYTRSFENEKYLECIIRTSAITSYHQAGTCAMGKHALAVVDDYFRVHNLKGLRVVDGSVIPKPLNNFPNTAVAVIAEYAATLLT
ncbi:neither inactivation nor afterpotential protein G isoform X2 [Photinus pyralis]|uniref:neither inactivation nor afterpotential protein G isoform X2 n=1 Tax=Photinus pyralis TaxID=7054 RepID=UPI0012673D58|nr:neither inactivation nor afterpotential protein G isoform X2 [Photinus pyralis]